jgi:hypothetical protein
MPSEPASRRNWETKMKDNHDKEEWAKHAMRADPGGIDPGACFSKQWFSSFSWSKFSKLMVLRKFDSLPVLKVIL